MKRKIYNIDVSDIPPERVDEYMEKLIKKMKKLEYVEPKLTRWKRIKRWFKDFATYGYFTAFGGI